MRRLSRFAPEELVGAALFLLMLAFVAVRPAAITGRFETPYATPVPGGGPARLLIPENRPPATPPALLIFRRELGRP